MSLWFHDTVSAMVYSLAQPHAGSPDTELQPPYNDLTEFVLRQRAQMPDFLRVPMIAATLGFDLLGCLRNGGLFHRRQPTIRQKQIAGWRNSSLAFQCDLIRYYESLATLALYSRRSDSAGANSELETACASLTKSPQFISDPGEELRFEIAVIGSGPGGAITACLLAEAGSQVLLVEEGPFHSMDSCVPFSKVEMLQKYRNGGQTVALGRNKIAYVEGRCVGGGSEINSGLYHRTPPDILERWRKEFQVEALSESDLNPHFETCERDLSVSGLPGAAPAASLKLHDGARRLGWKSLEIPRWFRYDPDAGRADLQVGPTRVRGQRQSMTQT